MFVLKRARVVGSASLVTFSPRQLCEWTSLLLGVTRGFSNPWLDRPSKYSTITAVKLCICKIQLKIYLPPRRLASKVIQVFFSNRRFLTSCFFTIPEYVQASSVTYISNGLWRPGNRIFRYRYQYPKRCYIPTTFDAGLTYWAGYSHHSQAPSFAIAAASSKQLKQASNHQSPKPYMNMASQWDHLLKDNQTSEDFAHSNSICAWWMMSG